VYTGVRTCTASNLVGAEKACMYSCIGYGDCVAACPFEAIYMGREGLPVIDLSKCTGCGECVRACPRNIIHLAQADEVVHVYCSSLDKGAVVRKICKAGCIACKRCEKDDDTGAVKVEQNLAVIDYSVNKAPIKSTENCPTNVIRISKPAPGYEEYFQRKAEKAEKVEQG
ncbi:MAG: 4Fe-4S dicluster domain-containing protein, partial [Spirochaetota bacterium]